MGGGGDRRAGLLTGPPPGNIRTVGSVLPTMPPHAIAQGAVTRLTQDAAAVLPFRDDILVAVADGVSGSPGGREAALLVVALATAFGGQPPPASLGPAAFVDLLRRIDQAVHADGIAGESTALVFALGPHGLSGASVGDTRALWVEPGTSHDLSAEQPRKPRIGSGRASPVGFSLPCRAGVIVAATDGLWESVADAAVVAKAMEGGTTSTRAEALLAMARSPRGQLMDDVTVIVIDVMARQAGGG